MLKINCDASVKRNGFVEIGFVIRTQHGEVIAVGLDHFKGNLGVICIEAIAIRCGLLFADSKSYQALIVESDYKRVIDLLSGSRG